MIISKLSRIIDEPTGNQEMSLILSKKDLSGYVCRDRVLNPRETLGKPVF